MMVAKVQFEIQRQLFARSERVKGIDFHPVGGVFPKRIDFGIVD
jgi:hypothetical protein